MAITIATLKRIAGGRDVWGGHGAMFFTYTGPSSYQGGIGGGDAIDAIGGTTQFLPSQTGLRNIDMIPSVVDTSGTYRIEGGPISATVSAKRWLMRWIIISTGLEVANTTNLSTFTTLLVVVGG